MTHNEIAEQFSVELEALIARYLAMPGVEPSGLKLDISDVLNDRAEELEDSGLDELSDADDEPEEQRGAP